MFFISAAGVVSTISTLISVASSVFFGLLIYYDAKRYNNNYAAMWGVLCGLFGWIPLIIYLSLINSQKRDLCITCGNYSSTSLNICPYCMRNKPYPPPQPYSHFNFANDKVIKPLLLAFALCWGLETIMSNVTLGMGGSLINRFWDYFRSDYGDVAPINASFVIITVIISLLSTAAFIFLGLAMYHDSRSKNLYSYYLWGISGAIGGLIAMIVYLIFRQNNAKSKCSNCGNVSENNLINCPYCGTHLPSQIPTQEYLSDVASAKRYAIIAIVLYSAQIILSFIFALISGQFLLENLIGI